MHNNVAAAERKRVRRRFSQSNRNENESSQCDCEECARLNGVHGAQPTLSSSHCNRQNFLVFDLHSSTTETGSMKVKSFRLTRWRRKRMSALSTESNSPDCSLWPYARDAIKFVLIFSLPSPPHRSMVAFRDPFVIFSHSGMYMECPVMFVFHFFSKYILWPASIRPRSSWISNGTGADEFNDAAK